MKKLSNLSSSLDENEDEHEEECSTRRFSEVSLSKVTVRQRRKKKSPSKPKLSLVADLCENNLSGDVTDEEKSSKNAINAEKLSPSVLSDWKTNSSYNLKEAISSDENDQPIEKNKPKKGTDIASIDSESSSNGPKSKQLTLKVVKENEDSYYSDAEGFIFASKKKTKNCHAKMSLNQITKHETQEGVHAFNKKSDSKVREPVEKQSSSDSTVCITNLFEELPNLCTELTPTTEVVDVELTQSNFEKQDKLSSPLKKKKDKYKSSNCKHFEEANINTEYERVEEEQSKTKVINLKKQHKKKANPENKSLTKLTIYKPIHFDSENENVNDDKNILEECISSHKESKHVSPKSSISKSLQNQKKSIQFEKDFIGGSSKKDIHKSICVSKEQTIKKDQIDSTNKTVGIKKKKHAKKRDLDEIEVLKAQLINKVLNLKNKSNEESNEHVLKSMPTDSLNIVKTPKKKQNASHNIIEELLSKALKRFDNPKKSQPSKLENYSHIEKSKTSLLKSDHNSPNLINCPKPEKNKRCNEKSKERKKKTKPTTEEVTMSEPVHQNTKDNLNSLLSNLQAVPKSIKNKRNHGKRKENYETNSTDATVSLSNIADETTKDNVDSIHSNLEVVPKSSGKRKKNRKRHENDEEINSTDTRVSPTKVVNKSIEDNVDSIPSNLEVVPKSSEKRKKNRKRHENYEEIDSTDTRVSPTKVVDKSIEDNVDSIPPNLQVIPKSVKKKRKHGKKNNEETNSTDAEVSVSQVVDKTTKDNADPVPSSLLVEHKSLKMKRDHDGKKGKETETNSTAEEEVPKKRKKKHKDKSDLETMTSNSTDAEVSVSQVVDKTTKNKADSIPLSLLVEHKSLKKKRTHDGKKGKETETNSTAEEEVPKKRKKKHKDKSDLETMTSKLLAEMLAKNKN